MEKSHVQEAPQWNKMTQTTSNTAINRRVLLREFKSFLGVALLSALLAEILVVLVQNFRLHERVQALSLRKKEDAVTLAGKRAN